MAGHAESAAAEARSAGPAPQRAGVLAGVVHGFSTRAGGVSKGRYHSLNFGSPWGIPQEDRDPAANVHENWRRLSAALGADGREVVQVYQVHGAAVHVLRPGDATHTEKDATGEWLTTKADAIVSDDPSRLLTVRIADCAPVLLADASGRVVGAVHAGWRGVVAGVAPAAVRAMREIGAGPIAAAIGPCISARHFEVGPEVVQEFRHAFGAGAPISNERRDGHAYIDLGTALVLQLRACGVGPIEVLGGCTVSEPDLYFSHRRDKGLTGRMAAVIGAAPGRG